VAQNEKPYLLTIPPQLRSMIYEYLFFDTPGTISIYGFYYSVELEFYSEDTPSCIQLLFVCKLISQEFSQMLYGRTVFKLTLPDFVTYGARYLPPKILRRMRMLELVFYVDDDEIDGMDGLVSDVQRLVADLGTPRVLKSLKVRFEVGWRRASTEIQPLLQVLGNGLGRQPNGTCELDYGLVYDEDDDAEFSKLPGADWGEFEMLTGMELDNPQSLWKRQAHITPMTSSIVAAVQNEKPHLLNISSELRLRIYKYLLPDRNHWFPWFHIYGTGDSLEVAHFFSDRGRTPLPLLLVCELISEEFSQRL
jgi:hypothetical protein